MESYDRPHKILERRRGIFFRFGLMISLLITFLAFEWKTSVPRNEIETDYTIWDPVEEEMAPITRQREEVMLPAPKEKSKAMAPVAPNPQIVIVPNHVDPIGLPVDSFIVSDIIPIAVKPESDSLEDDFVYAAEIAPEFPGKEKALMEYLKNNLRYPEIARAGGLNGTVYVNFIIDEKGNVVHVECARSPSPLFTAEAMRVIQKMPRWKPGIQGGKPVRVKMAMPVTFKLL